MSHASSFMPTTGIVNGIRSETRAIKIQEAFQFRSYNYVITSFMSKDEQKYNSSMITIKYTVTSSITFGLTRGTRHRKKK